MSGNGIKMTKRRKQAKEREEKSKQTDIGRARTGNNIRKDRRSGKGMK